MFVDASALCAVLLRETDGPEFQRRLEAAADAVTSDIVVFETIRAVLRKKETDFVRARALVLDFLEITGVTLVPIGRLEGVSALDALDRFGKGRHRAKLNMGDCFAYGCAKANGLPLMFKGDDFIHTDIERA